MKQWQQEMAIERMTSILLAFALVHHAQMVGEIVDVTGEKALFLEKVEEHQAIEHERSVCCALSLGRDALDARLKCAMFGLETMIETFDDEVSIETSLSLTACLL